jgi:hypothetical protein
MKGQLFLTLGDTSKPATSGSQPYLHPQRDSTQMFKPDLYDQIQTFVGILEQKILEQSKQSRDKKEI